jgi:hypothetical protein
MCYIENITYREIASLARELYYFTYSDLNQIRYIGSILIARVVYQNR